MLTDSTLEEQLRINDYTHENGIYFISAASYGLFGSVFCDFGEAFTVYDDNGETPVSTLVTSIESSAEAVVACPDDVRHGLESGDFVSFNEVKGMVELNGADPREVKVLGPYTFSIGDTSGLTPYVRGGIVTQVKMPTPVAYKSLRMSLQKPELFITDFAKFDRPGQLHIAFQALDRFVQTEGRRPAPGNDVDGAKVCTYPLGTRMMVDNTDMYA